MVTPIRKPRLALILALICALVAGCRRRQSAPSGPQVTDLMGAPADPLASNARATVLIFVSTTCPISNRYAPELRRLHEKFGPRGVAFHLVYPLAAESAATVGAHVRAFAYPFDAVRDPHHELVRRAGVTVTPEVALFEPGGKVAYRGRIDDREIDFGKTRPAPTRRDLEDALEAELSGRPIETTITPAIGCAIPTLD